MNCETLWDHDPQRSIQRKRFTFFGWFLGEHESRDCDASGLFISTYGMYDNLQLGISRMVGRTFV